MKARAYKGAEALYKFVYYLSCSVAGYYVMKDSVILPPSLGGSGSLDNIYAGYPYQKPIPYFIELSLFQLGYYIEDIWYHLMVKERQSDFWEMNLHHVMTISLISGMIMQNLLRIGVIIAWLHCLSDISTAGCRVLSHTVYKTTAIVCFIFCTMFWIVFRNYFIPLLTYISWTQAFLPQELSHYQITITILNLKLSVLCIMHLYWLVLFLKMIYVGVVYGKSDDSQRAPIHKEQAKTEEVKVQ